METLLDRSALNEHCKADMRRLLRQFSDESKSVAAGKPVYDHSQLPPCIDQLTSAKAAITKHPIRPGTARVPETWTHDAELSSGERKLFASIQSRLQATSATPKKRFPPLPLSAKEQDFIYRYAEHKRGETIARTGEAHTSGNAYRAYTEAFLSFMGRPPSELELQEASRLTFVERNGKVGVLPQPHAPTPHKHITNTTASVCACTEQIESPSKPLIRASRPGSTLVDRLMFSSGPLGPSSISIKSLSPARSSNRSGSPRRQQTTGEATATEAAGDEKKRCKRCGARLPPRLVKVICPACDV